MAPNGLLCVYQQKCCCSLDLFACSRYWLMLWICSLASFCGPLPGVDEVMVISELQNPGGDDFLKRLAEAVG